MDLSEITKNIPFDIVYVRNGIKETIYPQEDVSTTNECELDQLKTVPGKIYFYGRILSEVLSEITGLKAKINAMKGDLFFTNRPLLEEKGIKITDKSLENSVSSNQEIYKLKLKLAELEKNKTSLEIIINALNNKSEALIEIARRRNLELKINSI